MWYAFLANLIVYQGMTAHSVGKQMFGLRLAYVPDDTRSPRWHFLECGVARCALRFVLHFFDMILFIGILRALWNPYGKSWADSICHTVVIWDDSVRLLTKQEWEDYKASSRPY
jgi:uncharacterized RDD family membrane protein YckC